MISVLYLLTSRQPAFAGTDAVFQEVSLLCGRFNGDIVNLHPGRFLPRYPRAFFGFEKLGRLRKGEQRCCITHVYGSEPYFYPILQRLRNPLIYTIAAGVADKVRPKHIELLRQRAQVVVSNERDASLLQDRGVTPAAIIGPGIDTSHIHRDALPLGKKFTLLMASAPWVAEQFETKGIDVLLDTVTRLTDLNLILVWRGHHHESLMRRVLSRGIGDRVEIVNRRVAIDDYLRRAHAVVLLAKRPDLVKAYPHSLLESLAAGKPVLVSAAIPMADFVRESDCGVVVGDLNCEQLIESILRLMARYSELASNAMTLPPQTFSLEAMLEKHRQLYEQVCDRAVV